MGDLLRDASSFTMKSLAVVFSCLLNLCLLASQPGFASVVSKSYPWIDPVDTSNSGLKTWTILKGQSTFLDYFEVEAAYLPARSGAFQKRILPDTEQLVIVKKGELTITIQDVEHTIGSSSVALILPGDSHQIRNLSDEPLSYFIMSYRSNLPMNPDRGERAGGSLVVDFEKLEFNPHDKGGRRNNFDRSTAMTENFEMHITTLNEGITSHLPHTHAPEEIILMIHGSAMELINGEPHEIAAGDLAFLGSMIPHGIRNTGTETCMYFAFQWR
ncbi:MAG: (S)-ureidoglycine aminohydrolase [Candidatus Pelagisphaera sp.]